MIKKFILPIFLITPLILMLTGCVTPPKIEESGLERDIMPECRAQPCSIDLPQNLANFNLGTPTSGVLTESDYNLSDTIDLTQGAIYDSAGIDVGYSEGTINFLKNHYGDELVDLGITRAWADGWTGKGVTVAVFDTGIDSNHDDLKNQIVGLKCLTVCLDKGEAMVDQHGHGTHVAGIIAAELNEVGTTGVAPDAKLLIGKMGDKDGRVHLHELASMTSWAVDKGASVINLSSNYNVSTEYREALTEIEPGLFIVDNDAGDVNAEWGKYGFGNILKTGIHTSYVSAVGNSETILVAAAGNQALGFSTFPAQYAALEEEDGSHLLGGKILVVGAYDMLTNEIASFSNKAGTTCYKINEIGGCDQKFRVKDYYIMAPGMYMASTKAGAGTTDVTLMSGTSMAAPIVTGAVALLKQKWPHIPGDITVKILLDTADKTIPNYDENIHGQGLLDVGEAITFQGEATIPIGSSDRSIGVSSTVSGATVSLANSGALNLGGMNLSALNKVMIIDNYHRDFYVDLNSPMGTMYAGGETERTSNGNMGIDLFSGYNKGVNINVYNNIDVKIGDGRSNFEDGELNFEVSKQINKNIKIGLFLESDTFLGNVANNYLMDINGSQTAYIEYTQKSELNNDLTVFYSAALGATDLNVDTSSQMKNASMLISNAVKLGSNIKLSENSEFGVVLSAPLAITSGQARYLIPSSVSEDGAINYTDVGSSLIQNNREYSFGMYYNLRKIIKGSSNVAFKLYSEQRINASHGQYNEVNAGISMSAKF